MKSFKKIATAVVAAMTVATMVVAPANAAALVVNVNGSANTTTSLTPATVAVPSTNVIDAGHTVAITAIADTGTVVNFSGSGVSLVPGLSSVGLTVTVNSGLSAITSTSTGVAITVYAFTTSTNVGTVTITNGGYSTVVFIKGTAGPANSIAINTPKNVGVGTTPTIAVSAVDAFGNPVASEAISVTLIGTTFSDGSVLKTITTASATTAPGVIPATVLGVGTANLSIALAGEVTVVATDVSITPVVGLSAPVKVVTATYTVNDYATLNAKLKTQVEDLTAQLDAANKALAAEKAAHEVANADLTKTKADLLSASVGKTNAETELEATHKALADLKTAFNALAKKWNAKNPRAKIALLK